MRESLKNRAAAIRDYLGKVEPPIDPALIHSYSVAAARWEAARLLIDRGDPTAADDRRFQHLGGVLRGLTEEARLPTCIEGNAGSDGIPGLTWAGGFLPRDPQRVICDTWQEAAEGW
jgi:hypothetical protein